MHWIFFGIFSLASMALFLFAAKSHTFTHILYIHIYEMFMSNQIKCVTAIIFIKFSCISFSHVFLWIFFLLIGLSLLTNKLHTLDFSLFFLSCQWRLYCLHINHTHSHMYISIYKILISNKIKCETVIVFRWIFFAIFSLTPMAPLLFTYKSHTFTHVHSYVRNTYASQQPPWPCHLSASQRNLRCCTSGEVVLYFSDLSVGQHPAQRHHHHHRRQAGRQLAVMARGVDGLHSLFLPPPPPLHICNKSLPEAW